ANSKVESSSAFALAGSTNNRDNSYDLLLSKAGCTSTSALACSYERRRYPEQFTTKQGRTFEYIRPCLFPRSVREGENVLCC
ncbi:Uncharacterized protein APZ42_003449, partial [Daphnia magna]